MQTAVIGASEGSTYDYPVLREAAARSLEMLDRPLHAFIRPGDRVLIKPHMRHGSVVDPETRLVSHPLLIKALTELVLDCGGKVSVGDEGSKRFSDYESRGQTHRLRDLLLRGDVELVNFAVARARKVRSGLIVPRHYVVTNAALNADVIINCANFQPHPRFGLSGAVKNMFNVLVGKTQDRLAELLPRAQELALVIADVCRVVRPTLSVLDMTTVQGPNAAGPPRPLGIVLASTDPVALDQVAASIVGYTAPVWTTVYGERIGLGCGDLSQITVRGFDRNVFQRDRLPYPTIADENRERTIDRATRWMNKTILRPRPAIHHTACNGCGNCSAMCPVDAIVIDHSSRVSVDTSKCVDCHNCITACNSGAVYLRQNFLRKLLAPLSSPHL